jgi:hypothetical protein
MPNRFIEDRIQCGSAWSAALRIMIEAVMKAIQVQQPGGPEALKLVDLFRSGHVFHGHGNHFRSLGYEESRVRSKGRAEPFWGSWRAKMMFVGNCNVVTVILVSCITISL